MCVWVKLGKNIIFYVVCIYYGKSNIYISLAYKKTEQNNIAKTDSCNK